MVLYPIANTANLLKITTDLQANFLQFALQRTITAQDAGRQTAMTLYVGNQHAHRLQPKHPLCLLLPRRLMPQKSHSQGYEHQQNWYYLYQDMGGEFTHIALATACV